MSMEERGKFEQETLSNYGGRKSSSVKRVTGDGMNELIVITIIAAVDGACPQNVVPPECCVFCAAWPGAACYSVLESTGKREIG